MCKAVADLKLSATMTEAVGAIGSEHIILSTGGAQIREMKWQETLKTGINDLYKAGVSKTDVEQMTKLNPAKLLGI